MSERRLIRPSIGDAASRTRSTPTVRAYNMTMGRKGTLPPEQTNAEVFYYLKQMGAKTPMVVVLMDGEILRGWIEWYDKACVKLNRERGPNILLMKSAIRYMYKEEDERGSDRRHRREKERERERELHDKARPPQPPKDE